MIKRHRALFGVHILREAAEDPNPMPRPSLAVPVNDKEREKIEKKKERITKSLLKKRVGPRYRVCVTNFHFPSASRQSQGHIASAWALRRSAMMAIDARDAAGRPSAPAINKPASTT